MTKINWRVRLLNINFWIAFVPAMALLIEGFAALCGYTLDLSQKGDQILTIIRQIFVLLTIIGVVNDPTTKGLSDSDNAMTYTEPRAD